MIFVGLSNLIDEMLQFFKNKFKSNFVEPTKFKKDILNCYLSSFFIEELRNIYTTRERANYLKKQKSDKPVKSCQSPDSVMCFKKIQHYNLDENLQKFNLFKVSNILSNVKFYHFYKNDLRPKKVLDKTCVENSHCQNQNGGLLVSINKRRKSANPDTIHEELFHTKDVLMERQDHRCEFKISEDFSKSTLRQKFAKLNEENNVIEDDIIEKTLETLLVSPQRSRKDESPKSLASLEGRSKKAGNFDSDEEIDDSSILDIIAKDSPELLQKLRQERYIVVLTKGTHCEKRQRRKSYTAKYS